MHKHGQGTTSCYEVLIYTNYKDNDVNLGDGDVDEYTRPTLRRSWWRCCVDIPLARVVKQQNLPSSEKKKIFISAAALEK
jgi:hypothetical protein